MVRVHYRWKSPNRPWSVFRQVNKVLYKIRLYETREKSLSSVWYSKNLYRWGEGDLYGERGILENRGWWSEGIVIFGTHVTTILSCLEGFCLFNTKINETKVCSFELNRTPPTFLQSRLNKDLRPLYDTSFSFLISLANLNFRCSKIELNMWSLSLKNC